MLFKNNIIRISILALLVIYIIAEYPHYTSIVNLTMLGVVTIMGLYYGVKPAYIDNNLLFKIDDGMHVAHISPECSGVTVMALFLIVIFLVPDVDLRYRFFGLLLLPILFLANTLRIVFDVILSNNADTLIFLHATAGQLFIFIVMVMCFIIFIKISKKR